MNERVSVTDPLGKHHRRYSFDADGNFASA